MCFGFAALLAIGSIASFPAPVAIGPPPPDLPGEKVAIESASGSLLAGWFIVGQPHVGAVLLMHGVKANRLEMLGRTKLLHSHGFSVLLFDFQAHGESQGRNITFGYFESLDARAAFDWLRRKTPTERIGVLGVSLGGAAAILADPALDADAMVLEAVYATFDKAVENRLVMRVGAIGRYFAPLLTWQVKPRLGFDPVLLQPAARVARLQVPTLFVAGEADEHATLEEMKTLYAWQTLPRNCGSSQARSTSTSTTLHQQNTRQGCSIFSGDG